MNTMQLLNLFGLGGAGISFVGLALLARKQGKKWGLMFVGGVIFLLLAAGSLLFGFSL